mmetsp:Transcript_4422/g.4167  ORF Transcript_4422/g.4167 Transcript_4422/m.4167 type:complete len:140 (-) Transcript_4422:39-458(-)|eukprot:CAMPEP_0170546296 /NCGR_PEP_ID=MMETSP0211-20121228/4670_1 /TAXON_ID=311385 /ORGANISM="Pseudokeronopsis sp., Strain OXSARD2" /LENGTH=139 /DNA_ID=CAMNT_0010850691 /DNA_START=301 /DNA_END=720 /DNA_ORIENTATION=-
MLGKSLSSHLKIKTKLKINEKACLTLKEFIPYFKRGLCIRELFKQHNEEVTSDWKEFEDIYQKMIPITYSHYMRESFDNDSYLRTQEIISLMAMQSKDFKFENQYPLSYAVIDEKQEEKNLNIQMNLLIRGSPEERAKL